MVKNILIGALSLVLIGAVAVGVYDYLQADTAAAQIDAQVQDVRGQGQGAQGNGGQGQGVSGNANGTQGTGLGEPQSVPSDAWIDQAGVVQAVEVNGLSLQTDEGQALWIQLGPNHFWSDEIAFAVGDHVSVTGFMENGQFMAAEIVNDANGQAFVLRNAAGQPLWSGGNNGKGNGTH